MNTTAILAPALYIGAPAYHPAYSKIGHVAKIDKAAGNTFTIGGSGMERDRAELVIVWENLDLCSVSDGIARTWLDRAAEYRIAPITEAEAAARLVAAEEKQADGRRAATAERERAAIERAAFIADAAGRIPSWAQAVIVAELVEDQSDSMTDYFGSTRRRSVILAFSKHSRHLFPELRNAARNFAETASLADAPESAEHRENYSMGGGNYLKNGFRHSSGWQVRKHAFYGNAEPAQSLPFPAEWSLAAPEPEAMPAATPGAVRPSGIRIEEHTHTKKGFQMFICIMPDRVERAEFERLRDLAETLGGWYSKPWGKTPGGFAFKDRAAAETFANPAPSGGDDDGPKGGTADAPATSAPARAAPMIGDKLRTMADAMQADIDHKFRDRQTNTPKRQREADSARLDGFRLQRTQAALRALATSHDAGTVPPELASVRSKAAAFELVATKIIRDGGYYDAGRDTGEPYHDTPAARAMFAMIASYKPDEKAEELRRKLQDLQFAKIPGFFPTPRAVIDRMIDLADIPAGPFDLLEPEGGSGAILDVVKESAPDAALTTYERHSSLRDVLQMKGYALAGSDFMEAPAVPSFDRVLMNPPFENGQDIDHVRHAYAMLRDGGRLVAVMSPGPFFRQDRKATEFRAWFEACGGEKHDLPAGSFKESGTGTGTVLVVLDRDLQSPSDVEQAVSAQPAFVLDYRVGTCHFASLADAVSYYRPYGETRETVAEKVSGGEIFIGTPATCEPNERVTLDRAEGRYFIEVGKRS